MKQRVRIRKVKTSILERLCTPFMSLERISIGYGYKDMNMPSRKKNPKYRFFQVRNKDGLSRYYFYCGPRKGEYLPWVAKFTPVKIVSREEMEQHLNQNK